MSTFEEISRRKQSPFVGMQPQPPTETTRKSSLPRVFVVLVALSLVALWLAPIIVAKTPLRNKLLAIAATDLNGSVTAKGASFGWFSPILLEGVEVLDADGRQVFQTPRIEGTKSLLAIALEPNELGRFVVVSPDVFIEVTDADSNWERLLANLLSKDEEESGSTPAASIEIVDGKVQLYDEPVNRTFAVSDIDATVTLSEDPTMPIIFTASGVLDEGAESAGRFTASGELLPPSETAPGLLCAVELSTTKLPLEIGRAAVARVAPGGDVRGVINGRLKARVDLAGAAPVVEIASDLAADDFELLLPALGDERLKLAHVTAPCRIRTDGDRVVVDELRLASEIGQIDCKLTIDDIDAWRAADADFLGLAMHAPGEINGELDVARLAALVPRMLHVKKDLEITSGVVKLKHANRATADGFQWETTIETSQLAARRNGRPITWDAPLYMTVAAHENSKGVVIDRLYCDSDFLDFEGGGDASYFSVGASFDLGLLASRAEQFIDLEGAEFRGDGMFSAHWQRGADGEFVADIDSLINDFAFVRPGAMPWTEKQLEFVVGGKGRFDGVTLERIDSATAVLKSGGDQARISLAAPVDKPTTQSTWPVHAKLVGQASRWLARCQPWIGVNASLAEAPVSAQLDVEATATVSPELITIDPARVRAQNLRATVAGMTITDPDARLTAQARWTPAESRLDIVAAQLESRAVNAVLSDGVLVMPESGPMTALGSVQWAADLASVQAWTIDPAAPPAYQIYGANRGGARLQQTADAVLWSIDSQTDNFVLVPQGGAPWKEPRVRLTGRGAYETAGDALKIEQFSLEAGEMQCKVAGEIADLAGRRDMRLQGTTRYDMATVTSLLAPHTGDMVHLTGVDEYAFEVRGPMGAETSAQGNDRLAWTRQLTAKTDFGWRKANILGLNLGPSKFTAQLADGSARMEPATLAVSNGKLHLAPSARLTPAPMVFALPPGRLVEKVEITPEISRQALQYIAPVLAGATQIRGRFSIDMEDCSIPLDNVAAAELGGRMIVHQVEVGASPLLQDFVTLFGFNPIRTMKLKDESAVTFRMEKGRIYHNELLLPFEELTVRTYGSVGLDQSLAMIAEMPIPPKWLGTGRVSDALKDQTIRLPIGGTLSRPQIDRAALDQVAAQFIRETTRGVIQNEVNRQLDKLLNPLRKN